MSDTEPKTCDWSECQQCAALRLFVADWEAGTVEIHSWPAPPWWTSPEAEALYLLTSGRPRPSPWS